MQKVPCWQRILKRLISLCKEVLSGVKKKSWQWPVIGSVDLARYTVCFTGPPVPTYWWSLMGKKQCVIRYGFSLHFLYASVKVKHYNSDVISKHIFIVTIIWPRTEIHSCFPLSSCFLPSNVEVKPFYNNAMLKINSFCFLYAVVREAHMQLTK